VPGELAATTMGQLMLKPRVSEFVAAATAAGGEFEFAEIEVARYRGLVGKSLREVNFARRADALVVAIVDAESKLLFNPQPDRNLMVGDTLILVCKVGGAGRVESLASSEA
jgi:Trk K+ transport system NAD-binding subunit